MTNARGVTNGRASDKATTLTPQKTINSAADAAAAGGEGLVVIEVVGWNRGHIDSCVAGSLAAAFVSPRYCSEFLPC